MLSRGSSRSKEMAIRTALGSGIWRLIRQLLTESLVLSGAGGVLGLGLAAWSLAALSPIKASLNSAVLVFLLAISVATAVVFGLAPAFQAVKVDPISAIKSGPAGVGHSKTVRGTLVILEVALALVVVIAAGILAKSFGRLLQVEPGFNPHGLLTLRIAAPPSEDPNALFHRLTERLRPLPGVASIAAANALPLIADRANASRFYVPASPLINPDSLPVAQVRVVSPDYFRAMQIPLRSGRPFTERDLNQPVVIVNESLARRFWPGRDPVGARFVTGPWGPNPNWSTIIGVAGDVKQFGLDSEPSMDLYFPTLASTYLILRTSADPASLAGVAQREIQAVDRSLAVSDVRTMDQVLSQSASARRWSAALLSAFAALALLMSLGGIYSVISWVVAQRTREIGIRMALGAENKLLYGMVLAEGARLCAVGLAIGLPAAFALRRFLAGFAFDVNLADPLIYGGAVFLMMLAAMAACYIPARRASSIDPWLALR